MEVSSICPRPGAGGGLPFSTEGPLFHHLSRTTLELPPSMQPNLRRAKALLFAGNVLAVLMQIG